MKTARDLILELYKEDHITKEEVNLLLDVEKASVVPYIDWTSRPYEQPKWTITSNTNNTNVE